MSSVKMIREGYAAICKYEATFDAYADYHLMLMEEKPGLLTLASLPDTTVSARSNTAVALARLSEASFLPDRSRYFRGSGMIIVGNSIGKILVASYRAGPIGEPLGSDPVDEKYPGYQFMAALKTGLAMAIAKRGLHDLPADARYQEVQEILASRGLGGPSLPHHLGYAAVVGEDKNGYLAAGASGMLPSSAVAGVWRTTPQLNGMLLEGREKHWLDWLGDEAAGFHDEVFARTILARISDGGMNGNVAVATSPSAINGQAYDPNVNIH